MKTAWKTLKEENVPDIVAWVREAAGAGQAVHIGTDSLQNSRSTQFCTVVVVLTPGKGGRAAYCRDGVPKIKSLRDRLIKEVWRTVETAMLLNEVVTGELTCHVDANPDEKHMSSRYVQELAGMVVGQGFRVLIKPDAWCATTCADHVVRGLSRERMLA